MENKKYFCKICGSLLYKKNDILYCENCKIYAGKPDTFSIGYDGGELNTKVLLSDKLSGQMGPRESIFYAFYAFFVIVSGISIVILSFLR